MKYKIQSIQQVVENIESEKNPSISLGYRFIGHVEPGLISFVGRPSVGKTSFLVNIINKIGPKQSKVLVICNDGKVPYARRLVALESNLSNDDVITMNDLANDESKELGPSKRLKFLMAKGKVEKYNVNFVDSFEGEFDPGDFLELIHLIERGEDEILSVIIDLNFVKAPDYLDKLSKIAIDERLVIIVSYLLPREFANKQVTLFDLLTAFGPSFERNSSMIVLLGRLIMRKDDKSPLQSDLLNVKVLKNRFRVVKDYPLLFSKDILSIFECSQELAEALSELPDD